MAWFFFCFCPIVLVPYFFQTLPLAKSLTKSAVTEPTNVGSSIEKLNRINLRGSQGTETAVILTEVKQVIEPHLSALIEIREKLQTGDKEGAGSAVKLLLRDDESFQQLKDIKGVDIPASFELSSVHDISNDQIAKSVPLEAINAAVDHGQGRVSLFPVPA